MSKWLYFHASAIDSSSVTSHDSGTNIDFGAFPAESITSIMAEEDQIYLYFKNATRFEPVLDNYAALEGTFETMEQTYVRLTVAEAVADALSDDNGELVIFADEDNAIYSKKLRDLGCIDASTTVVTTHA